MLISRILQKQVIDNIIDANSASANQAELKSEGLIIHELIANDKLTFAQSRQLRRDQGKLLEKQHICKLVANDKLTAKQLLKLNRYQCKLLEERLKQQVCELIINDKLTVVQLLKLSHDQCKFLKKQYICELIANDKLTAKQLLNFEYLRYVLLATNNLTVEQSIQQYPVNTRLPTRKRKASEGAEIGQSFLLSNTRIFVGINESSNDARDLAKKPRKCQ